MKKYGDLWVVYRVHWYGWEWLDVHWGYREYQNHPSPSQSAQRTHTNKSNGEPSWNDRDPFFIIISIYKLESINCNNTCSIMAVAACFSLVNKEFILNTFIWTCLAHTLINVVLQVPTDDFSERERYQKVHRWQERAEEDDHMECQGLRISSNSNWRRSDPYDHKSYTSKYDKVLLDIQ